MHRTITIDLVLDRHTAKDALRATLHAVFFHRLFGAVKPRTLQVLDVTLTGVDDPEIEQLIDGKVDVFWKALEGGSNKRGQISVTLSDKRQKKGGFWWQAGEEEIPWEEWIITADVRQPKTDRERQASNAALSASLDAALLTILTHTSSDAGRRAVPPIRDSKGISPFGVRLGVVVAGVEVG